jgi:hypothetical protein
MLFANPKSFNDFTAWFLALAAKHPGLRFEIGLQVHLAVDRFLLVAIPRLAYSCSG